MYRLGPRFGQRSSLFPDGRLQRQHRPRRSPRQARALGGGLRALNKHGGSGRLWMRIQDSRIAACAESRGPGGSPTGMLVANGPRWG